MSGYVRIHRTLLGHPAFRHDGEALAFAWLIIRAAWRPTRVRYKGHDIDLKRGQLAISLRDFAEAMDRSKGWAERLFERLIEHGMIEKVGTQVGTQVRTRVGTHGGTIGGTPPTIVAICNYDEFQPSSEQRGTGRETPSGTADETRAGQQRDTEQRREELKKDNPPTSVTRPARMPEDVRAIMTEGGFVSPPPDLDLLKQWYSLGATLDQDIIPTVRAVRARLSKPPFKLKVFDAAIREKLDADQREIERLRAISRRFEQPDEAGFRV